jgi:maltooligosyltrehalose trehalohydrolase
MRRAHAMPFGAELAEDGMRFALWAPTARTVALVHGGREHDMPDMDQGWRRLVLPEARAGDRYRFRIDGDLLVPDPASRFQPEDAHGPSEVVDPRAFDWTDEGWPGRPWEEAVVIEVHVGTATPQGTFAALEDKLEHYAALGATAIELMPLADCPGRRNWGYDGVLPFAPDGAYGRPEDLKRLVDRAHALGLMMFLDVVYNHFGPSGNYLHAYAKSFFTERHPTPWGAGVNVDGPEAGPVRDFFVENALFWLDEYHFDGLRFDAVHAIADDGPKHLVVELAERCRAAFPDREIHLILENEANTARWLARGEEGRPTLHTAQWNDDLHNAWHALLTGEREGYYEDYDRPAEQLARALAEGFAFQGDPSRHKGGRPRGERSAHLPPPAFVGFLQNHDQVGNRAFGERLSRLVPPERLRLARALFLLTPQIPMLFMGEEWAASTPFLYFVDFAVEPELESAVRDGRRREFAKFRAFADPAAAARIPDPTDEATFLASKLDWAEAERPPHRDARVETCDLIRLRREHVVPLIRSGWRGAEQRSRGGGLDVAWRFAAGTLRLRANFGERPEDVEVGPDAWTLWAGPDDGPPPLVTPWSGLVTVEPAS